MNNTLVHKKCFKCLIEWPLHYFYKHHRMMDGHLNKCKKCAKKDVKEHRLNNIEKLRECDQARSKEPGRRKYIREQTKKHRVRYPDRYKARTAVGNAVRDGKLIKQPCCVCGNSKSTAHHEDYGKPLEVVWVCLKHHLELE